MPGWGARRPLLVAAGGCLLPVAACPAVAQVAAAPDSAAADPTPAGEGPQPAGQPDRVTGRRTYDAKWFAPFAPATALQIVQRVPGFAIEQVDNTLRGFGQAAGNVVINGQRPSAKSDTVETILSRIPASRVVRVEVGAGDLFGAEFTGKAQVLNLVTTDTGGLAGTLEGSVRRDFTGRVLPEGSASALFRSGASTFNAAVRVDNQQTSEEGTDRLVSLPSGALIEERRKVNKYREPSLTLSASWELNQGTNRTAHINVRSLTDRFRLYQSSDVTQGDGGHRDDALRQHYDYDEWEVGGDVTRPFAGGGLKVIGLATRRTRDFRDLQLFALDDPTGYSQRLKDRLAETVGRVTWTRGDWGGWNVEAGVEGVVNQLDSRVDLVSLEAGGAQVPINLPVDDARVREVRGEAFVTAGHALTRKLRVDAGMTVEASRLTVTGDASARRTLSFLKPRLVFDWRPAGKWHAQFTFQRTVNQLQFEDFISVAELSNDRVNGGNPDLVPQRSWQIRGTLEHPILGDGLARLELGYDRVQKVQDRVPTPEGFDAPGNLGDGDILIARLRVEAPLKSFGIKGGRLTLYGSYVPTWVRDPYTQELRAFTGNSDFYGSWEFRQDLGSFAWGFRGEGNTGQTMFRRDELDHQFANPYGQAFAEWRPTRASVVTFTVENILNSRTFRRRTFFSPDRTSPTPDRREFRERSKHLTPMLTFKRTF